MLAQTCISFFKASLLRRKQGDNCGRATGPPYSTWVSSNCTQLHEPLRVLRRISLHGTSTETPAQPLLNAASGFQQGTSGAFD
ncbi:hypothetical protein M513_13084 [Trichuris suis]|uniref:Uncharacterized protein n=1 Tax=Trichuris suis TaxID=68888 RepID=A0A085LM48_9BILA|nr:hypothetical protein M513_13084 [Trichuris suis]